MQMNMLARHQSRHACALGGEARLTVRAIVDCLLYEGERITAVAESVEELKGDFESYRARMLARVDALEEAVRTAQGNGAEVPPGVQSQIDALGAEIRGDADADSVEPAQGAASGTDNAPAGSGPSAGDKGLPTPVTEPTA